MHFFSRCKNMRIWKSGSLISPETIHLTQFCSDRLKIRFDMLQDCNFAIFIMFE